MKILSISLQTVDQLKQHGEQTHARTFYFIENLNVKGSCEMVKSDHAFVSGSIN